MKRILSVVFLAISAVGCSSAEQASAQLPDASSAVDVVSSDSTDAETSLQIASLATTDPDALYCPVGTSFSAEEKMCVTDTQAVGPFTRTMVGLCKKYGGGDKACESPRWERKFAARVRQAGQCPRGAVFDSARSACVEGQEVYGPFRVRDVEDCQKRGGGPACQSMRWNISFLSPRFAGGTANRKLFEFYRVRNNYDNVFDEVLRFYPAGRSNGCVAFMSTALRMSGTPVPISEYINGESVSLVTKPFARYLMERLNWTKITSANNLQPGDVVLTEDDKRYPGYPAHTYMFYAWSNQKAGIGLVIDNQDFIHERNIFGYGTFNFTPFAYALRSPE